MLAPVHPDLMDSDPFFKLRDGQLWVCWLGGRPAVNLGDEGAVVEAMKEFLRGSGSIAPVQEDPSVNPLTEDVTAHANEGSSSINENSILGGEHRLDERHEITIVARIRTPTGSRDVTIEDLSGKGCKFADRSGYLAVGTPITVKLGPIGPIESLVRWREGKKAGVEFATPLHPSVLDHIRQHFDLNSNGK